MKRSIATILAVSLLALPAGAATAQKRVGEPPKHERALAKREQIRAAMLRGDIMPLQRILAVVQRQHRGDVLEVELKVRKDDSMIYEVEMLTAEGQVRELHLNPRTGAVVMDTIKR